LLQILSKKPDDGHNTGKRILEVSCDHQIWGGGHGCGLGHSADCWLQFYYGFSVSRAWQYRLEQSRRFRLRVWRLRLRWFKLQWLEFRGRLWVVKFFRADY
jgi:hypothetical protein